MQVFEIECPDHMGDAPYTRFVQICTGYIEQNLDTEVRRKLDISVSSAKDTFFQGVIKVFRPIESQSENLYDFIFEEYEKLLASEAEQAQKYEPGTKKDEPKEDILIDVTLDDDDQGDDRGHVWTPQYDETNIQEIFTDSVIEAIALDSGCPLSVDAEKRGIIIHGVNYLTASRKLSNVETSTHRKKIASHVVHAEKLPSVSIQLVPLVDQPHDMLLRTLVPRELVNLSSTLPQIRTPRLVRLDDARRDYTVLLNQPQSGGAPSDAMLEAWSSLTFPTSVRNNQGVTNTPKQTMTSSVDDPRDAVKAHLSGASRPDVSHPNHASADMKTMDESPVLQQGTGQKVADESLLKQSPSAPRQVGTCRFDPPIDGKGAEPGLPKTHALVNLDNTGECLQSDTPKLAGKIPAWLSSLPATISQKNADEPDHDKSSPVPLTPEHHIHNDEANLINLDEPAPSISAASGHSSTQSHATMSFYSQPLLPSRPALPTVTENAEEGEEYRERLQQITEPETRRFHKTSAKQKGKGKKKTKTGACVSTFGLPLPDPLPLPRALKAAQASSSSKTAGPPTQPITKPRDSEIALHVAGEQKDNMLRILEHARSFNGMIDISIQLGQVLVYAVKPGESTNFVKLTMKKDAFESDLTSHLSADNLRIHFSRRLTAKISEACQIPTPHLWEQKPFLTEAFYEFILLDKNDQEVHVRVTNDANTARIMPPSQNIGQIHLHFPKRVWDARFLVEGSKACQVPEAVQKMIETITIDERIVNLDGENFQVPIIKYRIESNNVTVKSVYSKRVLHHRSLKQDEVSLQVSEVRQHELKEGNKDPSAKRADSYLPSDMANLQLLWFEASVHVAHNPLLDQNKDLPLGDVADWVPEDIIDSGFLANLKAITEQMVARMDGVGLSNRGLRGYPEDLREMANKEKAKHAVAAGLHVPFW